jgi:thiamine-monophosphate kinase
MTGALVGDSSERTLIARIRARLGASPDWLQLGPGDDAAVVAPPRNLSEVITTDVLVEGVHFDRRFVPPDAIGHRALAVNLSDLAAMGAAPRLATLSLVLPPALPLADFDGIIDGIVALAEREQTTIVGGNLSRSPGPLVVDVTAIGTVHRRKVLTRGGARPGDLVFVSGAIGAGRAGLEQCRSAPDAPPDTAPTRWYLRPQPRMRLGRELGRGQVASACMDLSDGLADALEQVAEASGVRFEIDRLLPVEPDAARWFQAQGQNPSTAALAGGDDYELLFTVPARRRGRLRNVVRRLGGLPITRIGTVARGSGVTIVHDLEAVVVGAGFSHFGPD